MVCRVNKQIHRCVGIIVLALAVEQFLCLTVDALYELLCFIMEHYIYLTPILTGVIIFVIVGR